MVCSERREDDATVNSIATKETWEETYVCTMGIEQNIVL